MSEVISFLIDNNFTTTDNVWYESPDKSFFIGVEDGNVVYWKEGMYTSWELDDPITAIKALLAT